MEDSTCGGWILDWWHNSAFDPDDGNEFYCQNCLKEAYGDANDQDSEQVQAVEEMETLFDVPKVAVAASININDVLGNLDDSPF